MIYRNLQLLYLITRNVCWHSYAKQHSHNTHTICQGVYSM